MAPSLVRLGLITLVFNLGGGLITPGLPLYARTLGADYRDLGLIGAAHGLAFAALTIPLGRASDRFGRRTLLVVAALGVGAAAACYLAATGVSGLVGGKLLEAAGWAAFWPALEAWVAEEFGRRAGSAMGVGYGAYAAAFVIGTAAAGYVIEAAGLRTPFPLYLLTATLTVGLVPAMPGGRPRPGTASRPPACRLTWSGPAIATSGSSRTAPASSTCSASAPSSRFSRPTGSTGVWTRGPWASLIACVAITVSVEDAGESSR